MRLNSSTFAIAVLAALAFTTGCTSKDQTASSAAAEADSDFQDGRYVAAARSIRRAIAVRDDVGEYWMQLAHIDMAMNEYAGAFDAYQNVLQFDRSNLEALRQLAQLALTVHQPDRADHYADQLLLLNSEDRMPLVIKGGAALQRFDGATALQYAERVIAINPHDASALILKAQVLAFKRDYGAAARLIEGSLDPASDQTSRLIFLRDIYTKTGDLQGYGKAVLKLAQAHPDDSVMQLTLIDLLYQTAHPDEAVAVLRRLMLRRPQDIKLAASAVELWLDQGSDALTPAQILAAKTLSLEMRAAVAQYANEIGRPDLALQLLGDSASAGDPNPANSDAKAAAAFAIGLSGHGRDGLAQLQQILDVDPAHPRALLARARLRALTNDPVEGLADARQVVADDPRGVTARLVLADILMQHGEPVLAEAALREAVRVRPDSVRAAARLAELLTRSGRADDVRSVLQDLARAAPLNVRARRLLLRYKIANPVPVAA